MVKFVLFLPQKDFRDESLSALRTMLSKWGIEFKIASYPGGDCMGHHGAMCRPDIKLDKVVSSDYDGIVLIDGLGIEEARLFEYRPLLDLLLHFNEGRKKIIAINNAVKIVARANIVKDKKVATPNEPETKRLVALFHGIPSDKSLEISDNIITIKGNALDEPLREVLQSIGAM